MKKLFCLLFSLSILTSARHAAARERLVLNPDQVALVGYGSLMSAESMSRTLGRPYTGPVLEISISGYQRSYNVAMPNNDFFELRDGERYYPPKIAYLNLVHDSTPGVHVKAILFVINRSDLEGFDRREWIYHRQVVTPFIKELDVHGEAIAYVGSPKYLVREDDPSVAVRETYLSLLAEACKPRSKSFASDCMNTTIPSSIQPIRDHERDGADPFGYKHGFGAAVSCEDILERVPRAI